MAKYFVSLLTVLICSSALADPVFFTCERPAWDGKNGCGEANTYETYGFYVDEDSIRTDRAADKEAFGYLRPKHVFFKVKGCDLEKGYPKLGRFEVADEILTLWLGDVRIGNGIFAKRVVLDLHTLTAEHSKVEHSQELTCTAQYGDSIPAIHRQDPNFYFSPSQMMPTRPDVGGRYPVR